MEQGTAQEEGEGVTATQKLVLCVMALVDLLDRDRLLHGYDFYAELEQLKSNLCEVAEEMGIEPK